MTEFVTVEGIKDALAECPVCTEYYNNQAHTPRRMPCCVQTICHQCLSLIYKNGKVNCPLCRVSTALPDGVNSLPKEPLVLRILDHLKQQQSLRLSCTGCSDKKTAVGKCDDCSKYLCEMCLQKHSSDGSSKTHRTCTFDRMMRIRSARPTTARRSRAPAMVDSAHLMQRAKEVDERLKKLSNINKGISKSKENATVMINQYFDKLQDLLKERRSTLLAEVESQAEEDMRDISKAMESHSALKLKLENSASNGGSKQLNLEKETATDIQFYRLGVGFVPIYDQHVTSMISATGHVKSVKFSLTTRPEDILQTDLYNAIKLHPFDIPSVPGLDISTAVGSENIFCPLLEWDSGTASDDVTVAGSLVTNVKPELSPPDSGCRIQAWKHVMASRPVLVKSSQRVLYNMKLKFSLRQSISENRMILETAVTSCPVEANLCQKTGLSLYVVACPEHKNQLCLQIRYDEKLITDIPISNNEAGASRDLVLGFLLDGTGNSINVIDIDESKVVCTVPRVVFEKPLWLMLYVDWPNYSDISCELVSGSNVCLTQNMIQLLTDL